ncbi:MAG: SGNH/GDSL hydrolase family protein [Pseudomonadota bacterium]
MTPTAPVTYVFGDSLSDFDNAFSAFVAFTEQQIFEELVADGVDPEEAALQAALLAEAEARAQVPEFGPLGAITNEFTYVDYAAQLGAIAPVNFAVASARAIGVQEPFGEGSGLDANLGGQLDRFDDATAGGVPAGSSAIVFIGANDLSDAFGDALADPNASDLQLLLDILSAIDEVSDAVIDAAEELEAAGVSTLYIPNLPLLSFFAAADLLDAESAALADAAGTVYNNKLEQKVDDLRADGVDAQIIDFAAVASAITEDPTGFGIIAPRSEFLIDGSTFDTDQVLAWDLIHPTEVAHQAWGAYLDFTLNGGTTSALSDAGNLSLQGSGANAVFANGGNDTVFAGLGDDVVFGGTGDDFVTAGGGADIVSGGAGDDALFGQGGQDIVDGDGGDDLIRGGSGDDILLDGLGNDTVFGGSGDDTFIFVQGSLEGDASATTDRFVGGGGDDTLLVVLDAASFSAFELADTDDVLDALGITEYGVETVSLLNGRGAVEDVLGGTDRFMLGDFWGLLPAPTDDLLV